MHLLALDALTYSGTMAQSRPNTQSRRLASHARRVAGLALVLAACADDEPSILGTTPDADAGIDAGNVDSGGGVDSGNADTGTDSGTDSGKDSGADAAPDAPVGQAPVAGAQTLTTVSGTALSIALNATDADSTTLTYAIVTNPTSGVLSGLNAATGVVTYTPNAGYVGADSFTFKANDGALDSAPATIAITVSAIPQAVAQGQAQSTAEDTAKTITLSATGGGGAPVTYAIKTAPTHGTLGAVAGADVTYTPSADYFGADSFVFTATIDGVNFTEATVNLTVTAVNDVPTATAQTGAAVFAGAPVTITLVGTDVETASNALSYAVANATNGTLGAVVGNTVTFTPTAPGVATFTFTAGDGIATSAPATISVTASAAPNCLVLLRAGQAADGVYPIDPDGAGATYPTLNMVCDMTTDGGGWTRVLNHDRVAAGGYFASKADALLRNEADPASPIYSVLQHLEGFRATGGFELRLNWPLVPSLKNIWEQTSNPTVAGLVTGYRAVQVNANHGRWGGLELSSEGRTLLDGSVNHFDYWFAVGMNAVWAGAGGMPVSPDLGGDNSTSHVQLWVRPPAVCGNGIVEGRETCDDNAVSGDGCSSSCAVERPTRSSCLAILTNGESVGDGAYVIDPDGAGPLASITTYCDMTRNGGGWTLVGKVGQGLFTSLSDVQYLALVANPTNDVDPAAFLDGNQPGYSSMAFFNRANTNALFAASTGKVVRIDMAANFDTSANAVYFQKKINPPAGWDFWAGLRDARLWNDNGATTGSDVNGFGTQFMLTRTAANYDPATHTVTHSGDGSFGWWDAFTHTLNDGTTLSVSRHGGLLGDGVGTGNAWLSTLNPTDGRWKNDSGSAAKSRIWIR
jgi:cysteine-rich repeat protein